MAVSGSTSTSNVLGGGADSPIQVLSKMPVLRPYVRLVIPGVELGKLAFQGPAGAEDFVIDDVMDPRTEKFQYLRSFEYNIMPGPEQMRVTLFDDRGNIRTVLTNLYHSVQANGKPAIAGKAFATFEFGWAEYDDSQSINGTSVPVKRQIKSGQHSLLISNIEISYESGGVFYQIFAVDTMTVMQSVLTKKTYPMIDIREAITQFLKDNSQKPELAEPVFGDDDLDSGPAPVVDVWQANGNNILDTIRDWTRGIKSKRGYPLYIFWNSRTNTLHVQDSKSGDPAGDLAGPHDVGAWFKETGTIVIGFKPSLSAHHLLASVAQFGYLDGDIRKVADTLASAQTSNNPEIDPFQVSKLGQGVAIAVPTQESGKEITTQKIGEWYAQYGDEINKALGTNVSGTLVNDAELECIGWPLADDFEKYMLKEMYLTVYAPFGLNGPEDARGGDGWKTNGIDLYLTGYYQIKGITHLIDESGYRMRIPLIRVRGPLTPPLSPDDEPNVNNPN